MGCRQSTSVGQVALRAESPQPGPAESFARPPSMMSDLVGAPGDSKPATAADVGGSNSFATAGANTICSLPGQAPSPEPSVSHNSPTKASKSALHSMGISGVVKVHEAHNWESERVPRPRLGVLGSADAEAIQQAISQHAAASGGPPLLLAVNPNSIDRSSQLQQALQREQSLNDALLSAQDTWSHVKELQASTLPNELEMFCDAIDEGDEAPAADGATQMQQQD